MHEIKLGNPNVFCESMDGVQRAHRVIRDTHGRWDKGASGNPAGRPKGAKNKRIRADPAYVLEWALADWRIFREQEIRKHEV